VQKTSEILSELLPTELRFQGILVGSVSFRKVEWYIAVVLLLVSRVFTNLRFPLPPMITIAAALFRTENVIPLWVRYWRFPEFI
jgi:uncharacterized membrane protein YtjA (UPF0391 family)